MGNTWNIERNGQILPGHIDYAPIAHAASHDTNEGGHLLDNSLHHHYLNNICAA